MSEIDYEELIRSPLDGLEEERKEGGWSLVVIGAAVGLLLGFLFTTSGGDEDAAVTTVATTTSTTTTLVVQAADYPAGYVELTNGLGARSDEVILGDDLITVAFTTAVRRGSDPEAASWPVGGSWVLESASGTVVESSRVVVGRFSPGAFSVQFPAAPFNGETSFTSARVVERWDTETFTGSAEVPFAGEPFVAPDTISIPVSQEVTLLVPSLELGRFLGSVEWLAAGAEMGATAQIVATLVDADGEVVGSYRGFPEIIPPGEHGVLEIFWSEPFPTSQEGAVTVSLEYSVGVARMSPISIEFDLGDVPVGR